MRARYGVRVRSLRLMISDTGTSRLALELSAGRVVSNTQVVLDAGSCQNTVPVEPKWPNVAGEQSFPNAPR
jgi:hypothetical protein